MKTPSFLLVVFPVILSDISHDKIRINFLPKTTSTVDVNVTSIYMSFDTYENKNVYVKICLTNKMEAFGYFHRLFFNKTILRLICITLLSRAFIFYMRKILNKY